MTARWQWLVFTVVVLAHVVALHWLARAMAPATPAEEMVIMMQLIDTPPVILESEPVEPEAETRSTAATPMRRRPAEPLRESAPMQAVIEPRTDALPAVEPDREFVSPEDDPFSRPVDPNAARFGRRELPSLPEVNRPRIAGERPVDAPLPEYRARDRSPKGVVEGIASFLGGGPNVPIEAPCGGRMNGGDSTAESFSPLWQQRNGCGDRKQGAGFDGSFDQPPGTVGSR